MAFVGNRPWENPEHWPHRIRAASIFGFSIELTVARDGEGEVAVGVWRERQRIQLALFTPARGLELARALTVEAGA